MNTTARAALAAICLALCLGALVTVAEDRRLYAQRRLSSIEDAERLAVEGRRAIKSGHVTLNVTGANGDQPYAAKYTIYFDEARVRVDEVQPYSNLDSKHGTTAEFKSTSVIGPDRHYTYSDRVLDDGSSYVFAVDDRKGIRRNIWGPCPDPRMLGMAPLHSNASHQFHLESFIRSADRDNLRMDLGELDGRQCKIISFVSTDMKLPVRAWIAPDLGYSVVRMTSRAIAR